MRRTPTPWLSPSQSRLQGSSAPPCACKRRAGRPQTQPNQRSRSGCCRVEGTLGFKWEDARQDTVHWGPRPLPCLSQSVQVARPLPHLFVKLKKHTPTMAEMDCTTPCRLPPCSPLGSFRNSVPAQTPRMMLFRLQGGERMQVRQSRRGGSSNPVCHPANPTTLCIPGLRRGCMHPSHMRPMMSSAWPRCSSTPRARHARSCTKGLAPYLLRRRQCDPCNDGGSCPVGV